MIDYELKSIRSITYLPSQAALGTVITIKACGKEFDKNQIKAPSNVFVSHHEKWFPGEWVEMACGEREVTYVMMNEGDTK
jgi:hypothetical protein